MLIGLPSVTLPPFWPLAAVAQLLSACDRCVRITVPAMTTLSAASRPPWPRARIGVNKGSPTSACQLLLITRTDPFPDSIGRGFLVAYDPPMLSSLGSTSCEFGQMAGVLRCVGKILGQTVLASPNRRTGLNLGGVQVISRPCRGVGGARIMLHHCILFPGFALVGVARVVAAGPPLLTRQQWRLRNEPSSYIPFSAIAIVERWADDDSYHVRSRGNSPLPQCL